MARQEARLNVLAGALRSPNEEGGMAGVVQVVPTSAPGGGIQDETAVDYDCQSVALPEKLNMPGPWTVHR